MEVIDVIHTWKTFQFLRTLSEVHFGRFSSIAQPVMVFIPTMFFSDMVDVVVADIKEQQQRITEAGVPIDFQTATSTQLVEILLAKSKFVFMS